ncbi:dihydroxyacetone kinase subunit DhaK [Flaviflagellibacter deserti]|uniref:Dihydroxyacetone kinase subunit DhaK n=1 Tax=Flaviflagellibacter deserti TaxID=2267266 RepID=A0ABV9YY67_9HYPH
MKKFVNRIDDAAAEGLAGFAAAYPDHVVLGENARFVRRRHTVPGKVALISGGGSGHEPLHAGFVGTGMLDAACPGHIFTSPTPGQVEAAMGAVEVGAGCLLIVKNYAGDRLNFAMAAEAADRAVQTVVVGDEVLVGSSADGERRGLAGTLVVEKILGASAERGLDLKMLRELGERVVERTRTIGVTLSSCSPHFVRGPTVELGPEEIEFGVGIHGELGRRRASLRPARALVDDMVAAIIADTGSLAGEEILLFVNGLGATPLMELHLMFGLAEEALSAAGARIVRRLVGTYVTSLDTAGCSLTVTRLDAEMTAAWDEPVDTPALRWGC